MRKINLEKQEDTQEITPQSKTIYRNVKTGETCSIKAGRQPWTWEFESSSVELKSNGKAIILEYVKQGLKQHKYRGGFDEATKNLIVKVR